MEFDVEELGAGADLGRTDGSAAEFFDDRGDFSGGDALDVHFGEGEFEGLFTAAALFEGGGVEVQIAADLGDVKGDGAEAGGEGFVLKAIGVTGACEGAFVGFGLEGLGTFDVHGLIDEQADDHIHQLLDSWTILHSPSRQLQHRNTIKVSPFYAPLFADLMPECSRERILSIRNPAMCPLLPILYWELGFSPLKNGMRVLPFADALPFGISRRTFFRHGWRRKGLHKKAVLEVGILSVDARLKSRMHRWFEEHQGVESGA